MGYIHDHPEHGGIFVEQRRESFVIYTPMGEDRIELAYDTLGPLVDLLIRLQEARDGNDVDSIYEVRAQIDQKVYTRGAIHEMVREGFRAGYQRCFEDMMVAFPDEARGLAKP